MSSLNKVILIGRLTADPELRYTTNGVARVNFTLAVDRPYESQNGARQTDFIPIQAWRQRAENIANHLSKGDMVAVEGRLEIDVQENNGERKQYTRVVADNVVFLSVKKWQQGNSRQEQSGGYVNDADVGDPFINDGTPLDITEDDLPF
ncbi:MAG: hypothetical protein A6D91_12180 [Bacillaceae bacterium G1]|nr:MAG: hypothetical protein A6D91_12180 [Bacillaceae bacterium G1]